MIRTPGNHELEWRLGAALHQRLQRKPKTATPATGKPTLSAAERVKFEMLHRQFTGRPVPGLRAVVQTARWLLTPWRGRA